jgi:hypothetical protein
MSLGSVDLVFAVPFDFPMFVVPDVLGRHYSVRLKSGDATLQLPRFVESPEEHRALAPPVAAVEQLAVHVEIWGRTFISGHERIAELETVAMVVSGESGEVGFDISSNQVSGHDIDTVRNEIHEWLDSFVSWVWALTSQSLDPSQPDPKFTHRKSTDMVHVAILEGVSSLAASGSPPLVVTMGSDDQCSERAADARVLAIAIARAGVSVPPLILQLLATSRMACRRGDRRRAIVDVGTAAEAALAAILGLPPQHARTLGGLVVEATKRGIAVLKDAQPSLVDPRNDAVHRGLTPSPANLYRALSIAEQLVAQVEQDLVPVESLRPVHRPQRHDLLFIRGPDA